MEINLSKGKALALVDLEVTSKKDKIKIDS